MKKRICFLLIFACVFQLAGCKKSVSAEEILKEFLTSYGIEGTLYSSEREIYEEGYISRELFDKIFITNGEHPRNFALFLNQRSGIGFEAGVFICEGAKEKEFVTEMCLERLGLIAEGEGKRLFISSGDLIFYTNASEKEKAEDLFRKIIRACY